MGKMNIFENIKKGKNFAKCRNFTIKVKYSL
jgi:hypothetical protein